jgi:hypothetical protein
MTRMTMAEPPHAGEPVREVGGPVLIQFAQWVLVVTHDVVGDGFRVGSGKAFEAFVFQFHELPVDLNLRRAPGRKDQVANVPVGLQHRGDQLRGVNHALRRRSLRGGSLRGSSLR